MAALQDASYTYADILARFNACLLALAGEYLIPELETWTDIETDPGVNHVRLPADYMRNLRYAHSLSHNREIKIYGSLSRLYRWFANLDQTGRVLGVCRRGRDLYYQRVPSSAESIRINYYRYPQRLESREDKPDFLPWHLAEPLLKHYALKELFSEIEDGIEGAKVNTNYHKQEYELAKATLEYFIGPEEHPPDFIETEIDWEELA